MSLYLEFEPHSWYKGFAIKQNTKPDKDVPDIAGEESRWEAYTDDGNTYRIVELEADTLKQLKANINGWLERQAERDRENRRRIGEL